MSFLTAIWRGVIGPIATRPIDLVLLVLLAAAVQGMAMKGQPMQPCTPVSSDRITGADMAAAVPQLSSLPPTVTIAYSPTPGMPRVFLPSELRRLGLQQKFTAKIASPVCFSWLLHPLARATIIAALQTALAGQEAEIEIIDQSHAQVPDGEVVFPLQGLSAASSQATNWSGYVSYAKGRRFATWVKVRVIVHEQQIVASHPLSAGALIGPADIQKVVYSGPLRKALVIHQDSEAWGKCVRQPIAAGMVLTESMLSRRQDVEKQQLVTVHIHCGAAHIETQGIAVDGGYNGDIIKVRNPKTGRIFLAKINERGIVTVVAGGDFGLVGGDNKS